MRLAKFIKQSIFKQKLFCLMQSFIKYLLYLSFSKLITFPFKKAFITLLSFDGSLATKYIS